MPGHLTNVPDPAASGDGPLAYCSGGGWPAARGGGMLVAAPAGQICHWEPEPGPAVNRDVVCHLQLYRDDGYKELGSAQ